MKRSHSIRWRARKIAGTQNGFFIQRTVLGKVKPKTKIAKEEVFGRLLRMMVVDTVEEAIQIANEVEYGLSSAVCTKSLKLNNQVVQGVESGLVKVNMTTTGTSFQAPFGGYKKSSSGVFKELGREAIVFIPAQKRHISIIRRGRNIDWRKQKNRTCRQPFCEQ